MPRYAKREFQMGEYWLGQFGSSPAWHRCWYDEKGRQTARVTLGTADYDTAKQLLTEWFIAQHTPVQEKPQEALLADVLRRYYEEHGKHARSHEGAKAGVNHWLDFWGTDTVAALSDIKRQEEFHKFLRARDLKNSTVARVLTVGKAALNRAFKRGELDRAPYILTVKPGAQPPMGRPLDVKEVKALYEAALPHIQILIAWMLGTAARTEAIMTLDSAQVLWEEGLVHLNPEGREQNKKYRPTVRLPSKLAEAPFEGRLMVAKSAPINHIKHGWHAARDAAGLDSRVTTYSLRHTAARWMRRKKVSEWDVATQLGHKRPGTTETYTAFDPDYLKDAAGALDALLRETCVRLPEWGYRDARRNGKDFQRVGWWARQGLNL